MNTTIQRRTLLCATGLSLAAPVCAQNYPARPIRMIVPYAAGGSTDQLARAIQQPMSEFLGQSVIIDNKPGAGGTIGTDQAAKAQPDGHTLVFGNTGPNAIVSLMRQVPYDPIRDLRPISTVALTPMILAVPADSPAKTMKTFIEYARQQGNKLNFGSTGNGSLSHLTGEYLNDLAHLRMQHVPYKGGAPLGAALMSNELHAAFLTGLDGTALLATGRVLWLAVGTPQRTPVVPGLSAIAEDVPGFKSSAWFGVLAPSGISDDIARRLNAAVSAAVARPEVQQLAARRNIELRSSSAQELSMLIRDEIAQWAPVIRRANVQV